MHDYEITVDGISKIEGHADLYLKVRNDKVENVQLRVNETKRYYTTAVEGKPCLTMPGQMSRICGTCSIAHMTAAISAVENALSVQPSTQTMLLRKLTMNALNIRDHTMHLYFFTLPDVLGKDSALEFDKEHESLLMDAFRIKEAGNKLCNLVAGRPVHPAMPTVGGFLKIPQKDDFKPVVEQLASVRPLMLRLLQQLTATNLSFKRQRHYFGLTNNGYSFLPGILEGTPGTIVQPKDFLQHLERVVLPYSTATFFDYEGYDYSVGALARMNLNSSGLTSTAKQDCSEFLKRFPSNDSFDNNIAQAIEVVNCIDRTMELLDGADFKPEAPVKPSITKGSGIGVVEAPRGTLYYKVEIDDSIIKSCNVVIPTQQNSLSIERDIKEVVEENIHLDRDALALKMEQVVRAYDPCMSCATHFLRVHWI